MKQSAKTRIIIWSVVSAVLIIALTANIIIFSMGASPFGFINTESFNNLISAPEDINGYNEGGAEIPAGEVKSLDIDWYGGSIEFIETDNSSITISEDYAENSKTRWNLDSTGTLHIRFNNRGIAFFGIFSYFGNTDKNLKVEIPAGKTFGKVDIDSTSADFGAIKLNAGELNITSASGNIYIGSLTAQNASIESVSGDVDIGGSIANKLTVESVSGNSQIFADYVEADIESVSGKSDIYLNSKAEKLSADTVSGNVTVYINKYISGFTVDREGVSGSITNEFPVTTDSNKIKYGDGSSEISIETISGNLTLTSVDKKPEL